ncbi:MAG: PIN domain nuclease [Bacteroidetes bacterium SW_8_64_56]|nr:MAG: PIN domain nuclease [Bacteroidetes bacterium SW_8_64_56]
MRILFDANVLIDAAVQSRTHHDAANQLLVHAERGTLDGLTTPTAIATCWYVSTATYGVDPRPLFEYLSATLGLAQMGWPALTDALKAPNDADFEDEYIAAAGAQAGAKVVVTRNANDFRDGPLTAHSPEEVLDALE